MSGIRVLLVRRAVADMAIHDDQRRPISGLLKSLKITRQHFEVIGVSHTRDVPAVTDEPSRDVLAERPVRRTVQRYAIVVIDPAEIGKLQMSGQRSRFTAHPFHQIAVGAYGVNVEIKNLVARTVEIRSLPLAGDGHSNTVSHSLAQRPGRSLDSGSNVRLGMSRGLTAQLTEAFDLLHRNREFIGDMSFVIHLAHLGQVQHRVEQHGSVPIR